MALHVKPLSPETRGPCAALNAAVGGGVVERSPGVAVGRWVSGAFLYSAELAMFERAGFQRVRKLGKWAWLVRREVVGAVG